MSGSSGNARERAVAARWVDGEGKEREGKEREGKIAHARVFDRGQWQPVRGGGTSPWAPRASAKFTVQDSTDGARTLSRGAVADHRQLRETNTIRLVQQIEPLDPFDDPFGDHAPPARGVTDSSGSFVEAPTAIRTLQPVPIEEPAADNQLPPLPPSERRLDGSLRSASDCDRIYNQQDCCAAEESCMVARDYLKNLSLRDIAIDITPRLTKAKSAADSGSDYAEERDLNLADAPSRVWRNLRGEVVAEGRLADYAEGRVVIRRDDGSTERIPLGELSDDDSCFVTAWWSIPAECAMSDESFAGRAWTPLTLTWKASSLGHKPLYFEEVQLERYGHTAGPFVQPVVSGAHFFLNVATLPYQMGIHPPNECQYALGYYRPGNCAPWLVPPIPLSIRGALAEAGAIVGGVFVIP